MTEENEQKAICDRCGAAYFPTPDNLTLGISLNVRDGAMPINGLRHPPDEGTTGWFIWAGEEFSTEDNFFVPLHVSHIDGWSRLIRPYLGLAPGWRFLVTPTYSDVWFDENLLRVS